MGEIVLVRHGETEWSITSRHTSYTDLVLTANGERAARALGAALAGRTTAAVFTSPRLRARRTAELAGLPVTAIDDDLAEWNYGDYEGLTKAEVWDRRPEWNQWADGFPGGETPDEIGARIDRVLARARPLLDRGDIVLVGHAHALRVAGARWIGLPPSAGGLLRLDTASVSVLGLEHGRQVIRGWNCR